MVRRGSPGRSRNAPAMSNRPSSWNRFELRRWSARACGACSWTSANEAKRVVMNTTKKRGTPSTCTLPRLTVRSSLAGPSVMSAT